MSEASFDFAYEDSWCWIGTYGRGKITAKYANRVSIFGVILRGMFPRSAANLRAAE